MSPKMLPPEKRGEAGFTLIELMVVLVFIGVVSSIAISASFRAFDMSRLSRTVADMRGVSNAIIKYQTDTSSLPAGGLQTVSSIAPTLRASAGNIAVVDGWGYNMYYEPFTTAGGYRTFRVYSYGKDGASDGVVTGTWVNFFTDIVIEGGSFVQTRW